MTTSGYRLTPAARRDLNGIWLFTSQTWSEQQADRYLALLTRAFERIADEPSLAREREEFSPPVRVYACEAHVIIYLACDDHVLIVRVRHKREDWMRDLAAI